MPSRGCTTGWGDSRVSNMVNRQSTQFCNMAGGGVGGEHKGSACAPPERSGEAYSKAVTFELSPKEEQVLWDGIRVEESVPRRRDIKNRVLRPERAECAQVYTRNWG